MEQLPERIAKMNYGIILNKILAAIRSREDSIEANYFVVLFEDKITVIPKSKLNIKMRAILEITTKQIIEGFTSNEWNRLVARTMQVICEQNLEANYAGGN